MGLSRRRRCGASLSVSLRREHLGHRRRLDHRGVRQPPARTVDRLIAVGISRRSQRYTRSAAASRGPLGESWATSDKWAFGRLQRVTAPSGIGERREQLAVMRHLGERASPVVRMRRVRHIWDMLRMTNAGRAQPLLFRGWRERRKETAMSLLLLVVLLLLVFGGLPNWGYHNYGYAPSGIGGGILAIVVDRPPGVGSG